ncbi:amidohydrolase [Mangrovimonas spongiae]|uniref:Amidohydrolase n=1 Tax=Mangrovimonas spongiae TaxID=2494697 RepID=A0A428K0E3_9FLAO|nr:amidohydrolase [Mangrovimonas spongiae]RSK39838.1 amidohydrolase [Mangrovimonas spongiae]
MNLNNLTTYRKQIHQNPELSGQEKQTAKQLIHAIKKLNPTEIITNINGYSFAVIFDSGNTGKTVMFRAELDALPIQEINTFSHQSKTKGVSHKCGHDGHMTILYGLAQELQKTTIAKGRVILLFQSAEETGEGAKAILNDEKFKSITPDFIFALHNVPGYPFGDVICKTETFTPSVVSLAVTLQGKTAHAAEPENGINPDIALQELIFKIKQLENPNQDDKDFSTIATVFATLGSKDYGISAGNAELHFTIRCWTLKQLHILKQHITNIVKNTCNKYQLNHTLDWFEEFASNKNDESATKHIKKAAKHLNFNYIEKTHPFKWGEDFGLFTQHYKGAMFGLGAGQNTPALHNPDYDFPDNITENGILMFYQILKQINA